MTVPVQSFTEPAAATVDAAGRSASAAAAALPVPSSVTAAVPEPGVGAAPPGDLVAVTARITGDVTGSLTLVVGAEVMATLSDGPLGPLDPVAGLRPTLVAAAAAVGAVVEAVQAEAEPTRSTHSGGEVSVPLVAGGTVVATLTLRMQAAAPAAGRARGASHGLDLLRDVEMEVTVEIGRTRMTVRDLLALAPGTVVELDRAAGSPADLLVNGTLLARGEIVVVDEDFGIRVTEIVSSTFDMGATR